MNDYQLKCLCENLIDNITVIKGFFELNKQTAEMKYADELMSEITDMTTKIKVCLVEVSERK